MVDCPKSVTRRGTVAAALVAAATFSTVAAAQDGLIVQPVVPQGFDRDRNVAVASRPRPSYTPTGARVGGLLFSPRLRTAGGATTNAYLTEQDKAAAPFVSIEPSLRVASIWSRHSLEVNAGGVARNYIGESRRNERTWNLGARGEVELGRAWEISAEANSSSNFENLFSGEVASNVAAVSRFRRDFVATRAEYTTGRVRTFVTADYADLRFAQVPLVDGGIRDQSARNRSVSRVIGQFEYARTPSVSLFGQLRYTGTEFGDRVNSTVRGNSDGYRAIAGANLDLAGQMRGTVGVGYSIRDYHGRAFSSVAGVVAEARVEFFPTRLFTLATGVQRTIEDSTSGNNSPFWDNRLSVRADYELLHNLIVSASGEYALQDFVDDGRKNSAFRILSSGRYLISRRLTLEGSVSYAKRDRGTFQVSSISPGEGRIQAGLSFHL